MKCYKIYGLTRTSIFHSETNLLAVAVGIIGSFSFYTRQGLNKSADFFGYCKKYASSYAARNRGVYIIGRKLLEKNIQTSSRKMKRYLETTSGRAIRSDTYIAPFVCCVLDVIFAKKILRQVFLDMIQEKCCLRIDCEKKNSKNCAQGLLGFQYELLIMRLNETTFAKRAYFNDALKTIESAIDKAELFLFCSSKESF